MLRNIQDYEIKIKQRQTIFEERKKILRVSRKVKLTRLFLSKYYRTKKRPAKFATIRENNHIKHIKNNRKFKLFVIKHKIHTNILIKNIF